MRRFIRIPHPFYSELKSRAHLNTNVFKFVTLKRLFSAQIHLKILSTLDDSAVMYNKDYMLVKIKI